ncbi:MAG: hypothetical protein K9L85_02745 [Candidatus Peribacteraceae bacterium]|nr:hypothetical protein [Candidatus Peribacteraceae bacterium]
MLKNKNILVISLLAAYLGFIGANLAWQQGDGFLAAILSADVDSTADSDNPQMTPEELLAAAEEARAKADESVAGAREEAKKAKEKNIQTAQDLYAAAKLRADNQTDSQKADKYQADAYEIALCKQKPEVCTPTPAINNPKYKATLDFIKKQKEKAETLGQMGTSIQKQVIAQKTAIQALRAKLDFIDKYGLETPQGLGDDVKKLQEEALENCLSGAQAVAGIDAVKEAAQATANAAKAAGISDEVVQTCDEWESEEECEPGVTPERVGTLEPSEGEAVETETVNPVEAEQKRQAETQKQCAALKTAASTGNLDAAAMRTSLNQLEAGIDSTAAKQQTKINGAKVAATKDIEEQTKSAEQQRQNKSEAAAATQLAANKAEFDAATEEAAGPSPIPIGFSNTGINGEKILPNFEGDVIPIVPVVFDEKYLVPSWNYGYGYGGDSPGSMNSPGMSNADLGYYE